MFSASPHPVPYFLAPAALPGAPKRAITNDLNVAACVGGQAPGCEQEDLEIGVSAMQRDLMLQTLIP